MGAAGVGSQVQQLYGVEMLTFASAILTLAVLFLSEIIPKTLGAAYWKRLSTPAAYLLTGLTKSLFMLIGPIQVLKSILPSSKNSMITRADVAAMADLGEIEGALDEDEEEVIHNLLKLREILVDEEMTPRVVVSAFEVDSTIKEILDKNNILRFSRIPVFEDNIDNILGHVIRSEILMAASRDEWSTTLREMMKPIHNSLRWSRMNSVALLESSPWRMFWRPYWARKSLTNSMRWKTCVNLRENALLSLKMNDFVPSQSNG
jgi:CBS domain containing-hemolysin-like protein